jgi:hypothetical protein
MKRYFYETLLTVFLLFSACSTAPPDIYVFEHLPERIYTDSSTGHITFAPSPTCMKEIGESSCGHGISIVSGKELFLGENPGHWYNNKPWSVLRRQSIYLPAAESYAPLATYIINSCKKMGCSSDVDKFKVKLNSLNGIAGAIENP